MAKEENVNQDETEAEETASDDFNQVLETAVAAREQRDDELKRINEWYKTEHDSIVEVRGQLERRTTALIEVKRDLERAVKRRYQETVGVDTDDTDVPYYDAGGYRIDRRGYRI